MADVPCPMCGKPNPGELEECQFCGANLNPVPASTPGDSQVIKPGEEPVKHNTSELEKISLTRGAPIHPGEAPTRKNTADLEPGLPSWLRSLRDTKRPAAGESLAEPSSLENPQESIPAGTPLVPAPDSSAGLPDWLSGLSKADSEDETVPDWLAGLRGSQSIESAPPPDAQTELPPGLNDADWMARLGNVPQDQAAEPPAPAKTPAGGQPGDEITPEPAGADDSPDWLKSTQSPPFGTQESPAAQPGGDDLPDWLSGLPGITAQSSSASNETEKPVLTENMPDRVDQQKQKSVTPEPSTPAGGAADVPDWLSSFGSTPATPPSAPTENVPEWLSNLEDKSGSASAAPAEGSSSVPQSAGSPPAEIPGWLSQLQAEVNAAQEVDQHKEDFEVASATPASPKETDLLPEWLRGIEPTQPVSGSTPALIGDVKDNPPGEPGKTAFSMEMPDWLSKLNPDQAVEKTDATNEDQVETGDLEVAELPSWVQALRPVESVVDTKTPLLDEDQAAEQSGPLAGLRGVLPAEPGMGFLRKPPAYSTKIQVSDGQQRYASYLEKLVEGEADSRVPETTRMPSNRLLRWLIAILLFLAVGLPFTTGANTNGAQIAPATSLVSSDLGASSKIIAGLAANVPVLVAFDYDPALSGELEAVAAPLMDQLLAKNVPLAFISTSPTGPALAEHFLLSTPLVNMYQYQSGVQYVNLGYLAGGPAGILYFANNPTEAMQFTPAGQSVAWGTGPLQGIQKLSNFEAVIILTGNADIGRDWIEQAGPLLGGTPMLMVISAQAEPMIRPYFDSGQIKGLVSGLSDAKIYEQAYNRPGLANRYWDSFSVGMLVAELLIVVGAILGVVTGWRARHKDSREEA